MKTSTGFKKAKKYLSGKAGDEKIQFICYALKKAGSINSQKIIMNRLGMYASANAWLFHKIGYKAYYRATYEQIQAWRHAWLDQLIAEFEARGD